MPPVLIGVAGGSGSGKTTVSKSILDRVGSAHMAYLQHDAYYRDRSNLVLAERAGLRREGDRARERHRRGRERALEPEFRVRIDEAHAVGADHAHPRVARDLAEFLFEDLALAADLLEAGGDDHDTCGAY